MKLDNVKYLTIIKPVSILKVDGQVVWQRRNYNLDGTWKLGDMPFVGQNNYLLNGTWHLGEKSFTTSYKKS